MKIKFQIHYKFKNSISILIFLMSINLFSQEIEVKTETLSDSKNQAERRVERKFQIGIFSPSVRVSLPTTIFLFFSINKKITFNSNFSSYTKNESNLLPFSSSYFVKDVHTTNSRYFDFGFKYFPFESFPLYFGLIAGKEFSNEKFENLVISNSIYPELNNTRYRKIEYQPSKFSAVSIGFNWQFMSGVVLNFNYNYVFIIETKRQITYLFDKSWSVADLYELETNRRTQLLQQPFTFSIGYAF